MVYIGHIQISIRDFLKIGFFRSPFSFILRLCILFSLIFLCSYAPRLGHTLVQGWTILVAWSLFAFNRKTDPFYNNNFMTLIAYLLMGTALLSLMHLVSMDHLVQSIHNIDRQIQFWILGGIVESVGIVFIFLIHKRKIPIRFIQSLFFILPIVFILLIESSLFPECYNPVKGFTSFLKLSSFGIGLVFLISFFLILPEINNENKKTYILIALSFIFSMISYWIYPYFNWTMAIYQTLAYIFKGLAYHNLYLGIILESIVNPLDKLKDAENTLRREQYFYDKTLAAVNDGMFRFYPEEDILYISPVWAEIIGYGNKQSVFPGEIIKEIISAEDFQKLKIAWRRSEVDFEVFTEEIQIRQKDQYPFWVMVRGKIALDQDGRECLIGMMTDISWRKKIEKELIIARDKAEESDRLKTNFLANISHEIRTPLNVILGFSGLIIKDLPLDDQNEERQNYLHLVRQSSNQLISIISDIIDISQLQNQKIDFQVVDIVLSDFFKNLFTIYRKLIDDNGKEEIRLEWKNFPQMESQFIIKTDIERFQQIWQNLLNNAMKFIEYGQIRFGVDSYMEIEKLIIFYVEDTGPGISYGKDKVIFERFRQGEEGYSRRYGGSGLGLSICRELLNLMGGEIHLDKTYTKGARFLFSLPVSFND